MSLIAQGSMLGLTGKFTSYSPLELDESLAIWFDAENAVDPLGVLSVPNAGTIEVSLNSVEAGLYPHIEGEPGNKIIVHDGEDDYLITDTSLQNTIGWTVYAVAANSSGTLLLMRNGSRIYFTNGWYYGDSPTVNIGANTSDFQIIKYEFEKSGASRNDTRHVGDNPFAPHPFNGGWKTIIGINRYLTAGEESAIGNWLATRL